MIYHTKYVGWDDELNRNALSKVFNDISRILDSAGVHNIEIQCRRGKREISIAERIILQRTILHEWEQACSQLEQGDWLIVEYPPIERFTAFRRMMKRLQRRGVQLAYHIVDFNTIRRVGYDRAARLKMELIRIDERFILKTADMLLSHNSTFRDRLLDMGANCDIYAFELYDHLVEGYDTGHTLCPRPKDGAVIIAANLLRSKASYLDELPEDCCFNLYGDNYSGEESENVRFMGAFDSEELAMIMQGSYGLIWDGDSARSVQGHYGEYLKYNTPHKICLYLSADLPVIVWSGSAMAEIISREKCGFTVDSLYDIGSIIRSMTDEEYREICSNAARIGARVRSGCYIRRVINDAFGFEEKEDHNGRV